MGLSWQGRHVLWKPIQLRRTSRLVMWGMGLAATNSEFSMPRAKEWSSHIQKPQTTFGKPVIWDMGWGAPVSDLAISPAKELSSHIQKPQTTIGKPVTWGKGLVA